MANSFSGADKGMQDKLMTLSVLVVDDQRDIRAMIRSILMDMGVIQVFEASNGREALNFVDDQLSLINFIICDWNMPGMNGIDFLRQIRSADLAMPFLLVTGRADKMSIIEARGAGVSAYIRKPFSPRQMEDKIRSLIQSK